MNADYAVIRDLVILNEPYIKGRRLSGLPCGPVGIAAWLVLICI